MSLSSVSTTQSLRVIFVVSAQINKCSRVGLGMFFVGSGTCAAAVRMRDTLERIMDGDKNVPLGSSLRVEQLRTEASVACGTPPPHKNDTK